MLVLLYVVPLAQDPHGVHRMSITLTDYWTSEGQPGEGPNSTPPTPQLQLVLSRQSTGAAHHLCVVCRFAPCRGLRPQGNCHGDRDQSTRQRHCDQPTGQPRRL
jgi:hypothetical protein